MQAFAHFLVRRATAWTIVLAVLLLSLASLFFASRVERDDDVLSFLPRENPEVGVFYDVSKRFGSLDVALVGISTDDALSPEFLTRLRALTKRLNETDGIGYAMTLTNVEDFAADPQRGGITTDYLVGKIPESPEERAALREKVLSRDHVVGNLISADAKSTLLYCFAGYGAEPKVVAQKVRVAVEEVFPREAKYWGGAPFISTYIYDVTQEDMRKLAPWAVLVIVLITVLSFRDFIGAGLALLSTGLGIVMSLGLMGALGVSVNVVLGSLPVILFALGSAYAVHILSRYYPLAHEHKDPATALVHTLCEVGPPVIASGLTTVVGLLSFLLMDIAPLRTFGIFTALGILITLILSLTFVPAVIYLVRLKGKPAEAAGPARFHVWLTTLPQRRRLILAPVLAALAIASGIYVGKVDSRMDNAAFFSKNSPPDQAEAFLRDHFGGSLFLQIQVEGDMTDPVVLRELRLLADRIAVLPHVSSVNHVGAVVAQINEAMEGDRRIPDTAAKVKLLYGFLEGKKAVSQLVTDDRQRALLQIKLDTSLAADTEPLIEKIRAVTSTAIAAKYTVAEAKGPRKDEVATRARALAASRIAAVGRQFGISVPEETLGAHLGASRAEGASEPTKAALVRFLGSEECSVELEGPAMIDKVASALTALGPRPDEAKLAAAIAEATGKPAGDTLVTDLADTVDRPLAEIWKRSEAMARAKELVAAAKIAAPEGPKGERFHASVATALMDLDVPSLALPPAAGEPEQKLGISVTGLPVMHAGLSRSVESNQWASMFFALGCVLLIMAALFRSFWSGLLGILPIVLTMAVIYGGMGLIGVRLDIGTSMLASLIIGAGVDYAVHLMVAWSAPEKSPLTESATMAARQTGPAIWVNALMVAAGFFVLTLGDARPLQNVGGLTAAAMITAALATMLVIPLFARKTRYYGDGSRIPSAVPSSEASDAVLDTSTSPP